MQLQNRSPRPCRYRGAATICFIWLGLLAAAAFGRQPDACSRPVSGSVVSQPPELRSSGGQLHAAFSLRTSQDAFGITLYCYIYGDSIESPTLRVLPGDEIVLTLRNELPAEATVPPSHDHGAAQANNPCGHGQMTAASSNLHFHGVNLPPVCHQDEAVRTLVQPGDAPFEYRFRIPVNQPPGLYWYHPHPHGFSERQVQGGASGALIVEGIEKAHPGLGGLPERILVLRDQQVSGIGEAAEESRGKKPDEGEEQWRPALDATLNHVPITFPNFKPSVMLVQPEKKELWRALNASSDTFFDLQLLFWPPGAEQIQTMKVVAIDGVPTGPAFAAVDRSSFLIPPGGRAEFVITTPPAGMHAQLVTRIYNNGPSGDRNTYRVLANLRSSANSPSMPLLAGEPNSRPELGFQGFLDLTPARSRKLYFSEKIQDPAHPKLSTSYFVTVEGAKPQIFDMQTLTPNITAVQGTVEDWTIENRAPESHVFHIHQLHFQLLARNGKPSTDEVLRDTIELPFWDGKSAYPRIKIRMDFRDPAIVGSFPYHCHILEHEDGGMMGLIEIVRPSTRKRTGK